MRPPTTPGFKARALHYASEVRIDRGIDTPDDWIYHQDTETMIGEDTVLGCLDFVTDTGDGRLIGAGIILYPQDWKYRFNSVEETTRSVGDLGAMGQMKMWGAVPFGYHGSHLIVRADVENEIGWDYGRVRSEDLLFSLKLRERFGGVTRSLKGFAYEKPPFTVGDHLKQRRRWILGSMEVLARKDVKTKYKLPLIYSLGSWLSAIPSIIATARRLTLPDRGCHPYNRRRNHRLHVVDHLQRLQGGTGDARGTTSTGPSPTSGSRWSGERPWGCSSTLSRHGTRVLRRTKRYEEIRKDDPAEELEDVVVDVEPYAEDSGEKPEVGDRLHQPLPFKTLNRRRL